MQFEGVLSKYPYSRNHHGKYSESMTSEYMSESPQKFSMEDILSNRLKDKLNI